MLVVSDFKGERWTTVERKALRALGIERVTISSPSVFGGVNLPSTSQKIVLRTYVQTAAGIRSEHPSARFLVPTAGQANRWFTLPRDERWTQFFGRDISLVPVIRDDDGELVCPGLQAAITRHFRGRVFLKSAHKDTLSARVYDEPSDAVATVLELLAFGCHRMPRELLVSDVMDIKPCRQGYRRKEYRCFVINGQPATTSIFTNHKTRVDYTEVEGFASLFASAYRSELPDAYCLDVADTPDGLRVVELNDIDASGIYADHDMIAFFRALQTLPGAQS